MAVLLAVVVSMQTSMMICAENAIINQNEFNLRQAISKAKIKEDVYENVQDNGLTTVYIWLKDIDQNEVETKVKKKIGFGKDELDVLDEIDLKNMNESKNKRRVEQEKTDKYKSSKREIAKNLHSENKSYINELVKIEDSIIFESQYAPLVVAELTIDEIESIAVEDEVLEIGYYSNDEIEVEFNNGLYDDYEFDQVISENDLNELKSLLDTTGITELKTDSGLSGKNVAIGAIDMVSFLHHDNYLPKSRCFSEQNITVTIDNDELKHSTSAALMISGSNGIASDSFFYMVESAATAYNTAEESYIEHIEELIDIGVSIINLSNAFFGENRKLVGKYTDYIVSNYDLIMVIAAGNRYQIEDDYDGYVTHPGNSDNVITVGAYNNNLVADKTYHIMTDYSSFVDENLYDDVDESACMKPDIVAPGNVLCTGTSIAAPFVTGVIALMLECRPSLVNHPEVVKAILMASCHYKAKKYWEIDDEETMFQGITEKQGAGVIDPYTALSITVSGNYGYGTIEENTTESIRFHQSPYDATGMNVSIAWLRDVNKVNNSYTYTNRNDLNLYVYKNGSSVFEKDENGDEIDTNKHSSSTEMVYSTMNSDTRNFATEITYDIEIEYENDTTDNSSESVRYGYAWSTDDEDYYSIFEHEGLYLIKNTASNKYLTYNTDNNSLSLMDYRGHYYDVYEQLFVISNDYTPGYFISDAFCITESNPYFINDGLTKNGTNLSYSTNPTLIQIIRNSEGQYILLADGMFLNYRDGLKWDYLEDLSGGEFWTFEKVNYKKGDVDMNGVINSKDQNYISDFYNGIYSPTNAEKFLADTNGDHVINNGD